MPLNFANKPLLNRFEQMVAVVHVVWGRNLLVFVAAVFVATLIGLSLWVSVTAITQKINVVRGTRQIIDVVDMARHIAEVEHSLGAAKQEDLLLRLSSMGQAGIAGDKDSLKTMTNPWGGILVAYTVSDSRFRMEDILPPQICARIVTLLTSNINSLGLLNIDVKGGNRAWRQLYVDSSHGQLNRNEIAAGCRSDTQVVLALTFSLR